MQQPDNPPLRRVRVAAQIGFLARKFQLDASTANTVILLALTHLDTGSSAATVYALGEKLVKDCFQQEASSIQVYR